jgi:hypothetical protein
MAQNLSEFKFCYSGAELSVSANRHLRKYVYHIMCNI